MTDERQKRKRRSKKTLREHQNFREELGRRIQVMRTVCEMRQQDLGDTVGISRPGVSMIETGRAEPSVFMLTRIADAFGCVASDLTGELDDQNS